MHAIRTIRPFFSRLRVALPSLAVAAAFILSATPGHAAKTKKTIEQNPEVVVLPPPPAAPRAPATARAAREPEAAPQVDTQKVTSEAVASFKNVSKLRHLYLFDTPAELASPAAENSLSSAQ